MASPPEKDMKIRTILPAARGRIEKYETLADGPLDHFFAVLDEVLGIDGAWLSDESSVGDFLSPLDSPDEHARNLKQLSAKLGFPIEAKTLIVEVLDLMAGKVQ